MVSLDGTRTYRAPADGSPYSAAVLGLSTPSQAGLLAEIDRLGTNMLTAEAGQSLLPRRGCPRTAPRTGCVRSTATKPWHFELRPEAVDNGCPAMYADPTQGPEDEAVRRTVGQNQCQLNHHTRKKAMSRKLAVVALIGAGTGCSNASNDDAANNNNDAASSSDAASSNDAASNDDDADNTTADNSDQGVKFAECMRENGVGDFPDPNASGQFEYGVSVSAAVFTAAVHACKDLQPPGTLSADRTPEQQSAALEFAQCVRDNGVKDFPDPVEGEPLVDTTRIPSSDTPEGMTILNAAMAKCGDLVAETMGDQ
jgi:hypothetical protein